MSGLLVVLIILIAIVVIVVGFYNSFVSKRNRVDNAWAQIEVQLQRRLDLIPNLVETVKGYAAHESGTFAAITEARTACMNARTPEESMESNNMLTGALKSLFAVAEAYPDLKANTNFLDLQQQLADTENRISVMRQSYNDVVMMFNNAIEMFPGVVFAGMFGFSKRPLFDASPGAEVAPQVIFVDSPQGGEKPAQ